MLQLFKKIKIKTEPFEIINITDKVISLCNETKINSGLINLTILHTSCSLTIQENADPAVLLDILNFLKKVAPEGNYNHDTEGPDDMPAHLKSLITQTNISLSLVNKNIMLGMWQGIYLLEHRASSMKREVLFHLIGEE
jgi:secondary thiamine-phosphate synthase enzyme